MTIEKERNHFIWTIGILSAIGVGLSVCNEVSSTPIHAFGLATVTRPVHALLGIGALSWIVFGHKSGYWMLVLWFLTAIPVLAFDRSMELVNTIIKLQSVTSSHSSVQPSYQSAYILDYEARGINYFPLLGFLWIFWATRQGAFPLIKRPRSKQRRCLFEVACSGAIVIAAGTLVGLYLRVLAAPLVIVAAEPGMTFYFKGEKLGSPIVRVTPGLLDKMGLDSSAPSSEWGLYGGKGSPWGHGIYVGDGQNRERIDVAYSGTDETALTIQTPFGERVSPKRHSQSVDPGRFRAYLVNRNMSFIVKPETPDHPISPGEMFPVEVRIHARLFELPRFHEMRFSTVRLGIETAEGSYRSSRWRNIVAPEGFNALNNQHSLEATLMVQAPFRPGIYSLLLNGWLYDENGDYAEPYRTLGYSSYAMFEVESDETDANTSE